MTSTRVIAKSVFSALLLALAAVMAAAQWTPEEMMNVKGVGTVQASPDGKRVAYCVTGPVMTEDKSEYLTQIWMAAADGSGSVQFTRGEKSSENPRWSPDGRWLAFVSERSGKNNLWLIRTDGGEAEMLTDVKSGVGGFAWSPDGSSVAFTMTDPPGEQEEKDQKAKNDARVVGEDHKMSHLWLVPAAKDAAGKREPRRLTQGGFTVGSWDWSPDGKTIVFDHTPAPVADDWGRSDISVVDVASGSIKPFAATRAAETNPLFSPDGARVAFALSDDPPTWGRTVRAVLAPAAGGPPTKLAATFDEQPNVAGWSADGTGLYFTEAQGTVTRLGFLPADGGAPRLIDSGTKGVFNAFLNSSRAMIGLSFQTSDAPPEAYVTPAAAWSPVQVSRANADSPKHPLGRTEVIRWRSPDKLEIEGLLTYPVGYAKGRRYPLVLVIHGGPAGAFAQSYIAGRSVYPLAAFAAEGWAVLRCNIRGSSGYGRAFRYANYKDWGGGDFRDLMAGVDRVIAMGVADPDRLGVMGWSYGGLHDILGDHPDKKIQGGLDRRAGDEPDELHRDDRHPQLHFGLFRRGILGRPGDLHAALRHVQHQERVDAGADPARRRRCSRPVWTGTGALQRPEAAGSEGQDGGLPEAAARPARAAARPRRRQAQRRVVQGIPGFRKIAGPAAYRSGVSGMSR